MVKTFIPIEILCYLNDFKRNVIVLNRFEDDISVIVDFSSFVGANALSASASATPSAPARTAADATDARWCVID